MRTLTAEHVAVDPRRLHEDAERGESSLGTRAGQPVMLEVPLTFGLDALGRLDRKTPMRRAFNWLWIGSG